MTGFAWIPKGENISSGRNSYNLLPDLSDGILEGFEVAVVFNGEIGQGTFAGHGHLRPQVPVDRFLGQLIPNPQTLSLRGRIASDE